MFYWLLVAVGALDSHGGADGDIHHDGDAGGTWWSGALDFINLGEVPITVALSVLSLCLWTGSLIANFYFTDHQALLALAFLPPNLIVSAIFTRYITLPLRPLFRMIRDAEGSFPPMIGQPCRITTSTATTTFGQAEVETKGAPLLIDVRTLDGVALPRGASAIIFREDNERGIYFVVEASNPQLQ